MRGSTSRGQTLGELGRGRRVFWGWGLIDHSSPPGILIHYPTGATTQRKVKPVDIMDYATQAQAVQAITGLLEAHGYNPADYDLSKIADEYRLETGGYESIYDSISIVWAYVDEVNMINSTAAKVAVAIARYGRSVASVAESTYIPRSTLQRKLAGKSTFTVDDLYAIAHDLGTPTTALLPHEIRTKQ